MCVCVCAYDMNNLPLLITVCVHVEFSRLCQQWGAFEWSWLSSFRADMAIYKVLNVLPSCNYFVSTTFLAECHGVYVHVAPTMYLPVTPSLHLQG